MALPVLLLRWSSDLANQVPLPIETVDGKLLRNPESFTKSHPDRD